MFSSRIICKYTSIHILHHMKKFIIQLGFVPKENTTGIFIKKYPLFDNYSIEVDFEKEKIVYELFRDFKKYYKKILDKEIENSIKIGKQRVNGL